MNKIKTLVPKKRLKEMSKWLSENPGRTTKDFVMEVLEKEQEDESEVEKLKIKKEISIAEKFKQRKGVKLTKLNEMTNHFLGMDIEFVYKTDGKITIKNNKIMVDKTIIMTRGVAPVVITYGILKSDKTDAEKLEHFERIFGSMINIGLLK